MENFGGKMAVVTGGGTGMGRELVRRLTANGCHVAMCDINPDNAAMAAAEADKLLGRPRRSSLTSRPWRPRCRP